MKTSLKIGMLIAAAGIYGSAWGVISKYDITVKNSTVLPITVYWTMKDNDDIETSKKTDGREVPKKEDSVFTEYDRSNLSNMIRAGRRIIVVQQDGTKNSKYVDSNKNYVEVTRNGLNIKHKDLPDEEVDLIGLVNIEVNNTTNQALTVYWTKSTTPNTTALTTRKTTEGKEIGPKQSRLFNESERTKLTEGITGGRKMIVDILGQRFVKDIPKRSDNDKVTIKDIIQIGTGTSAVGTITVKNNLPKEISVCWVTEGSDDGTALAATDDETTTPVLIKPNGKATFNAGYDRTNFSKGIRGGRKIIVNYLGQKFTKDIPSSSDEVIIQDPIVIQD